MKAMLIDQDGTIIETAQLMQVEGKAKTDIMRAFEEFCQEHGELDDDGEVRWL